MYKVFQYRNCLPISSRSRIFKRGFLKVDIAQVKKIKHLRIFSRNFEMLEALKLDFRLFLVKNYDKSNALNCIKTI